MNGYKIVLLKAILCFIGCRKVNGYAPEYVLGKTCRAFGNNTIEYMLKYNVTLSNKFNFNATILITTAIKNRSNI